MINMLPLTQPCYLTDTYLETAKRRTDKKNIIKVRLGPMRSNCVVFGGRVSCQQANGAQLFRLQAY